MLSSKIGGSKATLFQYQEILKKKKTTTGKNFTNKDYKENISKTIKFTSSYIIKYKNRKSNNKKATALFEKNN